MKKLEVQYTKRYYKSTTKEIEIPAEVAPDKVEDWIHEHSTELFEDEITSASLNFEEDEVYILEGFEQVDNE